MSIRTLTAEAFSVWTADRGIGRNPDDRLVFTAGGGTEKLWPYPAQASRIPQFVDTLLRAIRPNDRYWVYPTRGTWSLGRAGESLPQSRVWSASVRALGVPAGLRGAVGFNSTDWNELCAMLFLQVAVGGSLQIDMAAIPDNGSAILCFEQHDAVRVAMREPAKVDAVVAAMDEAGFPAPPLTSALESVRELQE